MDKDKLTALYISLAIFIIAMFFFCVASRGEEWKTVSGHPVVEESKVVKALSLETQPIEIQKKYIIICSGKAEIMTDVSGNEIYRNVTTKESITIKKAVKVEE